MKEVMEFDFEQFVSRIKELNQKVNVVAANQEIDEDKRHYMTMGWYSCLEEIINIFKECL